MVHTEGSGVQWACPAEVLFLDPAAKPAPELLEALLREGMPLAGQGMPRDLLAACLAHIPFARKLCPQAARARLGRRPLVAAGLSAPERVQVPFQVGSICTDMGVHRRSAQAQATD